MLKKITLKLGGACNLSCINCHCEPSNYPLKDSTLNWLKDQRVSQIFFSGGEPLLYMEDIRRTVEFLGSGIKYKLVTNGTLLTKELVDWFNANNIAVFVSYDGANGTRDNSLAVPWELVAKLKHTGMVTVVTPGNMSFAKLANDIGALKAQYNLRNIKGEPALRMFVFPHQTAYSSDITITKKHVTEYVEQVCTQIDFLLHEYQGGAPLKGLIPLRRYLELYFVEKKYQGCSCCNTASFTVTGSGEYLLCPYGHTIIGSIKEPLDVRKIEEHLPARCHSCGIKDICKNTCVANITTHECDIVKQINRFINIRLHELGIFEQVSKELAALASL